MYRRRFSFVSKCTRSDSGKTGVQYIAAPRHMLVGPDQDKVGLIQLAHGALGDGHASQSGQIRRELDRIDLRGVVGIEREQRETHSEQRIQRTTVTQPDMRRTMARTRTRQI